MLWGLFILHFEQRGFGAVAEGPSVDMDRPRHEVAVSGYGHRVCVQHREKQLPQQN